MSPNLPDPYVVLGVGENATAAEIKKAYRRLARENHPDSNQGDSAKESRFKDISAAYEIVGNPERRAQYDALKSAGPGAIPDGVVDLGDLFAQMFGGAPRGQPAGGFRYEVRNNIPHNAPRRGSPPGFNFPDLGSVFGDFGGPATAPRAARSKPKKKIKVPKTRKLSDGSVAAIRGLDLHSDVRIAVDQAILGTVATVATKTGKAKLQIPPGTSSGKRLRLRGKGLRARAGKVGDHYVTVQIDVPEKISDQAAKKLVQFMEAAKKDQSE